MTWFTTTAWNYESLGLRGRAIYWDRTKNPIWSYAYNSFTDTLVVEWKRNREITINVRQWSDWLKVVLVTAFFLVTGIIAGILTLVTITRYGVIK